MDIGDLEVALDAGNDDLDVDPGAIKPCDCCTAARVARRTSADADADADADALIANQLLL
jgi:hypothetical protein